MKLKVFAIYDSKAQAYMHPFYSNSIGQAVRMFEDASNDPKSQMCKHPGDFTLFHIGEYDDESGSFENVQAKQDLGTALSHKARAEEATA